ncbi:unnamed protein product [Calypogeia fissa]
MKDCINEPHFRRDNQSRVNTRSTAVDEDPPVTLTQSVVPPVEVLHSVLLIRPSAESPAPTDTLVRIAVPADLGTNISSLNHTIVTSSNVTGVTPLSVDINPDTLDEQSLPVDSSLGHVSQTNTSPSLPVHLCIRTANPLEAPMMLPEPFDTANNLELLTQQPPTSFLTEQPQFVDSSLLSPAHSPSNQGNSSGSKRWADYSLDSGIELPLPSHSPGGSRLVISPHQLVTSTQQRDRSLSPYKRESQRINLKSAARQARRSGNGGNRRGRK